jgi:hypothetical protein
VQQAEGVAPLAADAVALGVTAGRDGRGEARPPYGPRGRVVLGQRREVRRGEPVDQDRGGARADAVEGFGNGADRVLAVDRERVGQEQQVEREVLVQRRDRNDGRRVERPLRFSSSSGGPAVSWWTGRIR